MTHTAWLETYTPDLPTDDWAIIRPYVLDVVQRVHARVPYPAASLLNAVAHHTDWAVNVAGFDPVAEQLFRRDVIGAGVAAMPTARPSSMGRRRSLLLRVGESLGVIALPTPLPRLAAATPTTPYTHEEIAELMVWSDAQRDHDHRSARALLALGLGAGLPTRDICAVTTTDIGVDGAWVHIAGVKARTVPVRDEWADELAELKAGADNPTAPLFRPGIARTRNLVTVFVARSTGTSLTPSTQRMRSTWLVQHMADGIPMQDLLASAGLESMDALVRYQPFLPPPTPIGGEGRTR